MDMIDVLIVGAGPTGLMLANQLARRGVRVEIVDRHAGPAEQTRAMAVHARTLEIYAKLGLADRAVELGKIGAGATFWAQGRKKARLVLGDMGKGLSAHPYVLMLGQDDNERLLGANLAKQGVSIQWNTELIALEQQPNRVTATLKTRDGRTSRVTAAYVAGCDGGRSAVRELNGIEFAGAPYEHTFFVADTEAVGSMKPDELNVYLWKQGFHLFFPMRGTNRWRVIGMLPEQLRAKEGLTFDDVVPALVADAGEGLQFKSCSWFSTYKIHHRAAERFQNGRCFVLGDAAHVHSPMGGQGMNTGLQDAYNLAWKLALVVQGRANPKLLESYGVERKQVAERLLATTDSAFQVIVKDHWLATLFRTRIFGNVVSLMSRIGRTRRIAFATLSQTGISYPRSPLSRDLAGVPKNAPRAGDRFPWLELAFRPGGAAEDLFAKLDDTRFNLLVFGQPVSDTAALGWGDLLKVHSVAADGANAAALARAHVPATSFYLLRPDGHVALAGSKLDLDTLRAYFADIGVAAPKAQPAPVRGGRPTAALAARSMLR